MVEAAKARRSAVQRKILNSDPPYYPLILCAWLAGRCVFNLSESGRPAPREPASEPRKQKTKNKGGARGQGFKSEAGVVKRSFHVS